MLRWASDDAVDIYQRTTEGVYAQWVRAAAGAEIETIMTHHLPRADPGCTCDGERARLVRYDSDDMVAGLQHDLSALEAEARANDGD